MKKTLLVLGILSIVLATAMVACTSGAAKKDEKEIFQLDFMKKYKMKYFLKIKFPWPCFRNENIGRPYPLP